jgi:hypothetical protein
MLRRILRNQLSTLELRSGTGAELRVTLLAAQAHYDIHPLRSINERLCLFLAKCAAKQAYFLNEGTEQSFG